MKLVHPILSSPIVFTENKIQVLTIENPEIYRNIFTSFVEQSEGNDGPFILSVNDKIIDPGNGFQVFYDFLHLNIGRKLQNKLMSSLSDIIRENLSEETRKLFESINIYLNKISILADYPTVYDQCDNISSILKVLNFRLDFEGIKTIEAVYEIIKLYNQYFNNQCFILINAKSFFTEEELIKFYSMIAYNKINLLMVESSQRKILKDYENHILIDNDMCELFLDNKNN